MKLINSKKCLLFKDGSFYIKPYQSEVWAEISTYSPIVVYDISPTKTISDALEEKFLLARADPWPLEQNFLKVDCIWCQTTSVYSTKMDLPIAWGKDGYLVCPCCQAPWLFYHYKRE